MKIGGLEQSAGTARGSVAAATALRRVRGMALALTALLASWIVAGRLRAVVDYPVMHRLDRFARVVPALDRALLWTTTYYMLTGVVLMACVWYCWFDRPDTATRARLLAGTVAAFGAGLGGRALQLLLPTHLRPMHDPALGMTLPDGVDPAALNHWSSFPSDHAAVQFGLATVVLLASPALGRAMLVWVALLNAARVYLGVHFPTDITGGAALGVLAVLLAGTAPAATAARAALRWERRAPGRFYLLAFFLSYQIATLFDEARTVGAATVGLLRSLLAGRAA